MTITLNFQPIDKTEEVQTPDCKSQRSICSSTILQKTQADTLSSAQLHEETAYSPGCFLSPAKNFHFQYFPKLISQLATQQACISLRLVTHHHLQE